MSYTKLLIANNTNICAQKEMAGERRSCLFLQTEMEDSWAAGGNDYKFRGAPQVRGRPGR